jgi:nucleoside 2-deoxyribosyltransferase
MKEHLLYLAGPVTGTSFGETSNWRNEVIAMLPAHIVGLSPMRIESYLKQETKLADSYPEFVLSTDKAINRRAIFEVERSDAVLVNFIGASRVSIGTVMEIAWAKGKPIFVAMEKDNVHQHAMIRDTAMCIMPTLEEAVDAAIKVLSPFAL